jgi:hypothetical protein
VHPEAAGHKGRNSQYFTVIHRLLINWVKGTALLLDLIFNVIKTSKKTH